MNENSNITPTFDEVLFSFFQCDDETMVEELQNILQNPEILNGLCEVKVKSSLSRLPSRLISNGQINWSDVSTEEMDWLKLLSYSLDLPLTNDGKPVEAYCVWIYQHLRLHKESPSIDAVSSVRLSHFNERTSVWHALLKIITYAQEAKEKSKHSPTYNSMGINMHTNIDIQDPIMRIKISCVDVLADLIHKGLLKNVVNHIEAYFIGTPPKPLTNREKVIKLNVPGSTSICSNDDLYEQFTSTLRDAWKLQWLKESQLATETLFQLIYYITEHLGDDIHFSGLLTWPLIQTIVRSCLQSSFGQNNKPSTLFSPSNDAPLTWIAIFTQLFILKPNTGFFTGTGAIDMNGSPIHYDSGVLMDDELLKVQEGLLTDSPESAAALRNTEDLIRKHFLGVSTNDNDVRSVLAFLFDRFVVKIKDRRVDDSIQMYNLFDTVSRVIDAALGKPICESWHSMEYMRLDYACADLSNDELMTEAVENHLLSHKFEDTIADEHKYKLWSILTSLISPFFWECKFAENSQQLLRMYGNRFAGLYRAILRGRSNMKSILVDSEVMKDYPATPGKAFTHLVEDFNSDRDVHLANLFKLLTGAVDEETVGKIFELLREDERENEIESFITRDVVPIPRGLDDNLIGSSYTKSVSAAECCHVPPLGTIGVIEAADIIECHDGRMGSLTVRWNFSVSLREQVLAMALVRPSAYYDSIPRSCGEWKEIRFMERLQEIDSALCFIHALLTYGDQQILEDLVQPATQTEENTSEARNITSNTGDGKARNGVRWLVNNLGAMVIDLIDVKNYFPIYYDTLVVVIMCLKEIARHEPYVDIVAAVLRDTFDAQFVERLTLITASNMREMHVQYAIGVAGTSAGADGPRLSEGHPSALLLATQSVHLFRRVLFTAEHSYSSQYASEADMILHSISNEVLSLSFDMACFALGHFDSVTGMRLLNVKAGSFLACEGMGLLQGALSISSKLGMFSGSGLLCNAGMKFMERIQSGTFNCRCLRFLSLWPGISAIQQHIQHQGLSVMGFESDPNDTKSSNSEDSVVTNASSTSQEPVKPVDFLRGIMGTLIESKNIVEEIVQSAMYLLDRIVTLEIMLYKDHSVCAPAWFNRVELPGFSGILYFTILSSMIDYDHSSGRRFVQFHSLVPMCAMRLMGTIVSGLPASFDKFIEFRLSHWEATLRLLGTSIGRMLIPRKTMARTGEVVYAVSLLHAIMSSRPLWAGMLFSTIESKSSSSTTMVDYLMNLLSDDGLSFSEQHLIFELIELMSHQDVLDLRVAANRIIASETFWNCAAQPLRVQVPPSPLTKVTSSHDGSGGGGGDSDDKVNMDTDAGHGSGSGSGFLEDMSKRVMQRCFHIRAVQSALHWFALDLRGTIDGLDEEHVKLASSYAKKFLEPLAKERIMNWIEEYTPIMWLNKYEADAQFLVQTELGVPLWRFKWSESHNILHRLEMVPMDRLFLHDGRYVFDCYAVIRATLMMGPTPSSSLLEKITILNCALAELDSEVDLLRQWRMFMEVTVDPLIQGQTGFDAQDDTATIGGSTTQGNSGNTPLHIGEGGSTFKGDNRSLFIIRQILGSEKCFHQMSQLGEDLTKEHMVIIGEQALLLESMIYHQLEEVLSRTTDPSHSVSQQRAPHNRRLDKVATLEFLNTARSILCRCHRAASLANAAGDDRVTSLPDLDQCAQRLATCILLLLSSLDESEWVGVDDRRWMDLRLQIFIEAVFFAQMSLRVSNRNKSSHSDGENNVWGITTLTLELIVVVLPREDEVSGGGRQRQLSVAEQLAWKEAIEEARLSDLFTYVIQRGLEDPLPVYYEHDLSKWNVVSEGKNHEATLSGEKTQIPGGGPRSAVNGAGNRKDPSSAGKTDANSPVQDDEAQAAMAFMPVLTTVMRAVTNLCVPDGLLDPFTFVVSVVKSFCRSPLLQAYQSVVATNAKDERQAAPLFAYSSRTREFTAVADLWLLVIQVVNKLINAITVSSRVSIRSSDMNKSNFGGGELVVCDFMGKYGDLLVLPIRPCGARYTVGQLRIAKASLHLFLCVYKGIPVWKVLQPELRDLTINRVRSMLRAITLLLGDGEDVFDDKHLSTLQSRTIAVSFSERRRSNRFRLEESAASLRSNVSALGTSTTSGPGSARRYSGTGSGSPRRNSLGSRSDDGQKATKQVDSHFLALVEGMLIDISIPALALLAAAAPEDEGNAESIHKSMQDDEYPKGLYAVGTRVYFRPEQGADNQQVRQGQIVAHVKVSDGNARRQSLVRRSSGNNLGSPELNIKSPGQDKSGLPLRIDNGDESKSHSHLLSSASASGRKDLSSSSSVNVTLSISISNDADYHIVEPDGQHAPNVAPSRVVYTRPPMLVLSTQEVKRTPQALTSEASVLDDPFTTAHCLRLLKYATHANTSRRLEEIRLQREADLTAVPRSNFSISISSTEISNDLEAMAGQAAILLSKVLHQLSGVLSREVLDKVEKQKEELHQQLSNCGCGLAREREDVPAFRDLRNMTVDISKYIDSALEITWQYLGLSPAQGNYSHSHGHSHGIAHSGLTQNRSASGYRPYSPQELLRIGNATNSSVGAIGDGEMSTSDAALLSSSANTTHLSASGIKDGIGVGLSITHDQSNSSSLLDPRRRLDLTHAHDRDDAFDY